MKKSAGCAILLSLLFLLLPALLPAQQASLTILHTNDTHSHLLPFSYPPAAAAGSGIAQLKYRTDIGGIARRATLVKRLRKELNSKGTAVWLVDAGDFIDGTPFSTEYHGEADAAAMNAAGYNYGILGNHEFNQPLSQLKSLLGKFQFPILCANAVEESTGALLIRGSEIRRLGPLKIGIFGIVTRSASRYPAAREGIAISDEVTASRHMVQALRPEADIVVAISHSGYSMEAEIAATVPGIDVIIGGHSHTRLPSGELVWHSDELYADKVNGTILVQAHQWGGELGRLDLLFGRDSSGDWHIQRYRASLIPVTSDIPEDKTVAAVVDRYWKPIAARYGEIIGRAAADFIERGDDLAPYNLVADAVRETFSTAIELENMGGVRAPLAKGAIRREDLVAMVPFDNTVVTFKIRGSRLKQILLKQRPAVSGIRYRIENGTLVEATVGGKRLDENRVYTCASNSYLARTALEGIQYKDTGKLRLDVLTEYIRKNKTVRPVFDGRRVVIGR
jgi:5'-nucleotidase/UDP-sugar diphosphatase